MPDDEGYYPVLACDGAYIDAKDEYVRVLFYRDQSAPRKTSDHNYTFDEPKREILQEIRMTYQPAKLIGVNLAMATSLHESIVIPRGIEPQGHFHNDADEEELVRRAIDLVNEIFEMIAPATKSGQEEILKMIRHLVAESKPKIDAIIAANRREAKVK